MILAASGISAGVILLLVVLHNVLPDSREIPDTEPGNVIETDMNTVSAPEQSEEATSDTSQENIVISTPLVVRDLPVSCAPNGILDLGDGNILVTDIFNKNIWNVSSSAISVFAGADTVKGLYGEPLGGYKDKTNSESLFREPWDVVPFMDGYAVSDASNHVVRLIHSGNIVTVSKAGDSISDSLSDTVRHAADTSSDVLNYRFARPTGLAADPEGNLYVSDTDNGTVDRITPEGEITSIAKGLSSPAGLLWHNGDLYIAESGGNRILKMDNGKPAVIAGSGEEGFSDGDAKKATFSSPQGLIADKNGDIYVSDTANGAIRKINGGKVSTIVAVNAEALETWPVSPIGMAIVDGRLYICDSFSRKVYVIELT